MKDDNLKEVAYNRIEGIFNTSITNIIEEALRLGDNCPDEFLISLHFAFRQSLKKATGTARRIEGLSELWYFLYIKKFLEDYLKIQFETIGKQVRDLVHYHFKTTYKGCDLILSSDLSPEINFELKIHPNPRIRPDIFIGLRKKDKKVIPIALFEIKLHRNNPNNIEKVISRFIVIRDTLKDQNITLLFFIFLYLQHSQYKFKKVKQDEFDSQLERFRTLFAKARLVINRILKWEQLLPKIKIEGSIYQIMREITSNIESLCQLEE